MVLASDIMPIPRYHHSTFLLGNIKEEAVVFDSGNRQNKNNVHRKS